MKTLLKELTLLSLTPFTVSSQTNRIEPNGNVGIGTTSPRAALEMKGDLLMSQADLPMGLNAEILGTTPLLNMDVNFRFTQKNTSYIGAAFRIDTRTHVTRLFQWLRRLPNNSKEETLMILDENGNLGIGTEDPREKLSVNGNMRARAVKVETENWPDYVFRPEYSLTPLNEIESFIRINNHLPGIPNAEQIAINGVDLGEMNKKLLEKIEELTLHSISAKKEEEVSKQKIEDLQKTINSNSTTIELLISRIEKLEKIQQR